MTAPHRQTHDLTRVLPGDRIEVWDHHQLRHTGTVSQTAPHLGVLWILEAATGIQKLIPAKDYRLHHVPLSQRA